MSIKMQMIDSDKLEIVLGDISRDSEAAGLAIQKKASQAVKSAVENRLQKIKQPTVSNRGSKRPIHLADDVKITTKQDEFGDTVVKVQGGAATGTLWHIVNDGTYRSKATHFMDNALADVEPILNAQVNEELEKVFG